MGADRGERRKGQAVHDGKKKVSRDGPLASPSKRHANLKQPDVEDFA